MVKSRQRGGLCINFIPYPQAKDMPLISIITVTLNSEKYIEDTMKSVLAQTYQNYNYIIVDGGSRDHTLNIIASYESLFEGRMKWVSEPDSGIYDAMNKGIGLSNGEIIGIINSDDWYNKDTLNLVATVYSKLAGLNKYLIIAGNVEKVNYNKQRLYIVITDGGSIYRTVNQRMPLNHPATFVTRATYDLIGNYDGAFKYSGDYDFFFRALSSSEIQVKTLDHTLAYMRVGGTSDRLSNLWQQTIEDFKVRKGKQFLLLNFLYSAHHLLIVLMKQTMRKLVREDLRMYYYQNKVKLPGFIKTILKI